MIFSVFQKIGFWGILGSPYYGIGATIRIGPEMLCLPYAGFFLRILAPSPILLLDCLFSSQLLNIIYALISLILSLQRPQFCIVVKRSPIPANIIQDIPYCPPTASPCYTSVSTTDTYGCKVSCTGLYADVRFTQDKLFVTDIQDVVARLAAKGNFDKI